MPWSEKPLHKTLRPMARVSGKTDDDRQLKLLGDAIRARREVVQLSQEALADAAKMDRAHIGKIERGERNLTLLNLLKIAQAVKCRASDILAGAGL
jgi:DNA-binding XRE family transcriptional regulator